MSHKRVPVDPRGRRSEVGAPAATLAQFECVFGEVCTIDQVGVFGADDPDRGGITEAGDRSVLRALLLGFILRHQGMSLILRGLAVRSLVQCPFQIVFEQPFLQQAPQECSDLRCL